MSTNDHPEPLPSQKPSKKGVSFFTFFISLILVLGIGVVLGTRSNQLTAHFFDTGSPKSLSLNSLQQTQHALKQEYDGTLNDQKLIEGANRGLVEAAGDPYTIYLNKSEAEEFDKDLEGTFSGIGAELDKKDDKLIIVTPLDDSPAKKAGILPGDVIARVNGNDTSDWSIDKAVSQIKGKKGTTVKLTVLRGEEVKEFSITRDIITDPSVKSEQKGQIGVLRISRFGNDTATLARQAAQTFKDNDVKAVIVDLRGNGGGYLESAQEISSLWLENETPIVSERKGTRVTETHHATGDPLLKGIPTVVLIDGGSASASEIVAGALQDNRAATLVGQKSFGKGSVQRVVNLSDGAKLKVTTAKWYTPKGTNISKVGITPDVAVEFGKTDTKENDPQLNKALELLK